ncbi:MAG TPA: FtsX-like permease family protein, partial [Terriglobales bacterium]|nr:FtsX-like permease family protein [Terriglobales bacterium]
TLGISVGVASLVAMLSLGIGLQALAGRHLRKAGLFDTVVVSSRRDFRFNREAEKHSASAAKARQLDEPARQQIERLPNVLEAYPDVRFITELQYQGQPHLTMVAGLPFSAKDNDAFEGMQGSFFSSDSAPEGIIQRSFAEELLGREEKPGTEVNVAELAKPLLGQELSMRYAERVASSDTSSSGGAAYSVVQREQKLKIVGVSDLDPDTMRGSARARVFVPLKLAEDLHIMQPTDRDSMRAFSNTPTYLTVTVRVKNPSQVRSVQDSITKLGFSTFSILDATKSLQRFFAVLDLFLGIFGSLALAVASLGIVNTLVMAILERRREIGIMKAIGGSDQDVKKLFFAEAGAMGLLGGVFGVLLGWLIGRAINFGTNIYLQRQELPPEQIWFVPWWLVFGAVGFALLVSLFSGLYPASRAARLDPVQALRYE